MKGTKSPSASFLEHTPYPFDTFLKTEPNSKDLDLFVKVIITLKKDSIHGSSNVLLCQDHHQDYDKQYFQRAARNPCNRFSC